MKSDKPIIYILYKGRNAEVCLVKEPYHGVPNNSQLYANPQYFQMVKPINSLLVCIKKRLREILN